MHKPNIVRTFSWSPKGLLYQSQKGPQPLHCSRLFTFHVGT